MTGNSYRLIFAKGVLSVKYVIVDWLPRRWYNHRNSFLLLHRKDNKSGG